MRFADLLGIALSALWQQKVRTLLTMIGVIIGTFVLVVSLSVCRGLEQEVMRQLKRGALSRQVIVWPGSGVREKDIPADKLKVKGSMSEAKRERIRQAIIHRWPRKYRGVQLNRKRLSSLMQIRHVQRAVPLIQRRCQAAFEGHPSQAVIAFAADADNQHFRNRIVAGDYLSSDNDRSVVVSEYLLYLWGITNDEAVDRVVGRKLLVGYRTGVTAPLDWLVLLGGGRLNLSSGALLTLLGNGQLELSPPLRQHLEKALREYPGEPVPIQRMDVDSLRGLFPLAPWASLSFLPAWDLRPDGTLSSPGMVQEEFTVVGVIREFLDDRDRSDVLDLGAGIRSRTADLFLPVRTAERLFAPGSRDNYLRFPGVVLTVDDEKNVKEVAREVRSMGLHEDSLVEWVQGLRTTLVVITFSTTFLAAVALLVAALGITNTMTMSVLERTREIGIMKAVGARDCHILFMFLVEGALIGLIGGGIGVLLGWIASFPGDAIAHALLQDQSLPALKHTLFVFPPWLTLGAPLFAGLVTTLAAVYPARRATRVNPITALRHE
jgi:putative ABC transport system permease protein